MGKHVGEQDKADAVRLILAGKSTKSKQAKRLNVTRQAVQQWVNKSKSSPSVAAGGATPVAAPTTEPTTATPPAATSTPAANPNLASLGNASGWGGKNVNVSGIPDDTPNKEATKEIEQRQSAEDSAKAVSSVEGIKGMITWLAEAFIGLPDDDPALVAARKLNAFPKTVVEANAALVNGQVGETFSGPYMLGGVLLVDVLMTGWALYKASSERGNLNATVRRKKKLDAKKRSVEQQREFELMEREEKEWDQEIRNAKGNSRETSEDTNPSEAESTASESQASQVAAKVPAPAPVSVGGVLVTPDLSA